MDNIIHLYIKVPGEVEAEVRESRFILLVSRDHKIKNSIFAVVNDDTMTAIAIAVDTMKDARRTDVQTGPNDTRMSEKVTTKMAMVVITMETVENTDHRE